jgi:FkbM family methyltransferase
MAAARKWIASMLLGLPAPLRELRNVPILGAIAHRLSHKMIPADEKLWARVERGPAKGLWIELNPRTGQHYLHGEVEPIVQQVLVEKLRPGMVFYDLGANIGFFTLLASRIVGEKGKVISFEPDPEIAARLRRNVERNGFKNVLVVEAGIWSVGGPVNFVAADDSSPDRGVGKFVSNGEAAQGKPTQCVALDEFVRNEPVPDVIKCDVEGAEVEVFRGARNLLAAHHPMVLCELHSKSNEVSLREQFSGLGYALKIVDDLHMLVEMQAVAK